MGTDAPAAQSAGLPSAAKSRGRSSYFFGASIGLLIVILIGFAPTFFLRPFFGLPPMSLELLIHGLIMTAWFTWLVLQTWLVRSGQTPLYRRMGWIGAGVAAAVVFALTLPSMGAIADFRSQGLDWDSNLSVLPAFAGQDVTMIEVLGPLAGNMVVGLVFAAMFVAAVLLRGNPEAHKRLLLLGTLPLTVPALGRAAAFIGPIVLAVPPALILSLLIHDFRERRWPHWATLAGIASVVIGVIAARAFSASELGKDAVRLLG